MRRTLPLLALAVLLAACTRQPRFDLPIYPDSSQLASGGNIEGPDSTQLHVMLQNPANLRQVRAFYRAELTKRGWPDPGADADVFTDGNLTHSGEFGKSGVCTPVDPGKPGGYVAIAESRNSIIIDLWQSFPKAK